MVAALSSVRGHWLETLQLVVTTAAELLGADSIRCVQPLLGMACLSCRLCGNSYAQGQLKSDGGASAFRQHAAHPRIPSPLSWLVVPNGNLRSVYFLSKSGNIHAPLACHGDAGGAVRLGMPLPTHGSPGAPPAALTALQRLFLTGVSCLWNESCRCAEGLRRALAPPSYTGISLEVVCLKGRGQCEELRAGVLLGELLALRL